MKPKIAFIGTGGTIASLGIGSLDLQNYGATGNVMHADEIVTRPAYLRDVVDSQDGPVTMNLSGLSFCDAAGLGVLARVAGHARRSGRSLKLTAARPSLLRIMAITGMDEAFPEVRNPALATIALPRQAAMTSGS